MFTPIQFPSENVQQIETPKTQAESNFMESLISLGEQLIQGDKKLQQIEGFELQKILSFFQSMKGGYAEISGSDKDCRLVCVPVQGSIEEGLSILLQSGEVTKVKALFVTPLPPTPLRKASGSPVNTPEKFDGAREYTLEKRESTVRTLRDSGAEILVAYIGSMYEELKQKDDLISKNEVFIFEQERKKERMREIILKDHPGNLVGALYFITDKHGNQYYLSTQGIQAQEAKPAVWKKWFTPARYQNEGVKRANEMLEFVKTHSMNSDVVSF